MNTKRLVPVVALCCGLVAGGAGCGSADPSAATVVFPRKPIEITTSTTGDPTPSSTAPSTTATTGAGPYGDTVKIDRSQFERELKALNDNRGLQAASGGNGLSGAGKNTVDPRLSAGWLTALVYDALITHEFERRHLAVTAGDTEAATTQLANQFGDPATAQAFPKWFRDRLVARNARAVALRQALSGVDLSEASVRKYFDAHQDEFAKNCLSHILVKTKAEADAALARVKGGEEFAAVAKAVSVDTGSGAKGGDLGCNPKGAFVPEFDQAAATVAIGQVSDPVQTQYGFHLILVRERQPGAYEANQEQARAALNAQSQGAFRQFLLQAGTRARVTVDRRFGTFAANNPEQAPAVVPPVAPKPNSQRTDNLPGKAPEPEGELPGSSGNPTTPVG